MPFRVGFFLALIAVGGCAAPPTPPPEPLSTSIDDPEAYVVYEHALAGLRWPVTFVRRETTIGFPLGLHNVVCDPYLSPDHDESWLEVLDDYVRQNSIKRTLRPLFAFKLIASEEIENTFRDSSDVDWTRFWNEIDRNGYAEVSAVGFGAWAIGGFWGPVDDRQSMQALHAAVDAGTTFIDTADVYGNGHSERLVGQLLRERPGERLVVATKAGRRLPAQVPEGYTRANLETWVHDSLANLRVETLSRRQLVAIEEGLVSVLHQADGNFLRHRPVLAGIRNENVHAQSGALPRFHLMPQPALGTCSAAGACPASSASAAARRSAPVTGVFEFGRLPSNWPR